MRGTMRGSSSTGRPSQNRSQLGDLEVGVLHLAGFIQEDLNLAVPFQTGDGVNGDACHGDLRTDTQSLRGG